MPPTGPKAYTTDLICLEFVKEDDGEPGLGMVPEHRDNASITRTNSKMKSNRLDSVVDVSDP